jgi:hypothetical protein
MRDDDFARGNRTGRHIAESGEEDGEEGRQKRGRFG